MTTSGTAPSNVTPIHWLHDDSKRAYAKQEFDRLAKQYGQAEADEAKDSLKASIYSTPQGYIDAIRSELTELEPTGTDDIPF